MSTQDQLIQELKRHVSNPLPRIVALLNIANNIRERGPHRWVGLYDVDHMRGVVTNIVWAGPEAPAYPEFPIHKGLTGAAISARATINVGDVTSNPNYLTSLGSTKYSRNSRQSALQRIRRHRQDRRGARPHRSLPRSDSWPSRPAGQGLNDLYIRFFRVAERRIVGNIHGQGIVCLISNNAWLDGLSHPTMRYRYLHTFQQLFIDNLNGDKYRTGKTTPEGLPDPSAFSTPQNREGIQVGTAITTLVRNRTSAQATEDVENNSLEEDAVPALQEYLAATNSQEESEPQATDWKAELRTKIAARVRHAASQQDWIDNLLPSKSPQ